MLISENRALLPFLKWAGGKRWLIEQRSDLFDVQFDRYIEPFVGAGATFFHLTPQHAVLSDKNSCLIETYRVIRQDWRRLFRRLQYHQRNHSETHYYAIRSTAFDNAIHRAAQFIYLNRTCWNGLYRVNLKGAFNVPIGTKSNVLLDTDNFEATAKALANTQLVSCDFEESIGLAQNGDFVFVDPPYTVKHNANGFVKYNEHLFTWEDQVRLRDCILAAQSRGAKILVTNANHRSIRELYRNVGTLHSITRYSIIGAQSINRGQIKELVVKCF